MKLIIAFATPLMLLAILSTSCGNTNGSAPTGEKQYAQQRLMYAVALFDSSDLDSARIVFSSIAENSPDSTSVASAKGYLSKLDSIAEIKNAEAEKKLVALKKNYRREQDEMQDMTFYYDKASPKYTNYNAFMGYVGQDGKSKQSWVRLRIQYVGEDWLFIKKYIIKADTSTFEILENSYGEIKKDNSGGKIWEWLDRTAGPEELLIMYAVANSKKAKIRCSGQDYYDDRVITDKEKRALKNILSLYEAMDGTVPAK
jgi:hypothetical protein